MSDLQEQVQEAIDRAVSSGAERGQKAYNAVNPTIISAAAPITTRQTGKPGAGWNFA